MIWPTRVHSTDGKTFYADDKSDDLAKLVTWEPRSLSGADAITRLEEINTILYGLLNPHPPGAEHDVK